MELFKYFGNCFLIFILVCNVVWQKVLLIGERMIQKLSYVKFLVQLYMDELNVLIVLVIVNDICFKMLLNCKLL